jgi:carotenoid 1,2-hydratase
VVDAQQHCAINVCVYSPGAGRWAMTERGSAHLQRSAREFVLGPSRLAWDGNTLQAEVDERCAPLPRRVRGRIVVRPEGLSRFAAALDAPGRHRWGPIAPCARIEVDLPQPGVRWSGQAYVDSNEGDEPIEDGFVRWDWLRASLPDGRCAVLYDAQPRQGAPTAIGACLAPDGSVQALAPGPRQRLAPTPLWRIDRRLPLPEGEARAARVERTLEDTPFYARSLLQLPWGGASVAAVHETLDVQRLTTRAVQAMLPFRMPRVA